MPPGDSASEDDMSDEEFVQGPTGLRNPEDNPWYPHGSKTVCTLLPGPAAIPLRAEIAINGLIVLDVCT